MFTFAAQPVLAGPQWRKKNGTARPRKQSLPSARSVPQRKQYRPPNIVAGAGRWHTARSAVLFWRCEGQTLSGQSPPAFWNHRLTSILLGFFRNRRGQGVLPGATPSLGEGFHEVWWHRQDSWRNQLTRQHYILYIVS